MFCKECGKFVSDTATACPHCGATEFDGKVSENKGGGLTWRCNECGKILPKGAKECPYCHSKSLSSVSTAQTKKTGTVQQKWRCSDCGKLLPDNATECPNCYSKNRTAVSSKPFKSNYKANRGLEKNYDSDSIGYVILGFFLPPIVSLILYFVWKDNYPQRASCCLKGMLIGLGLVVLLVFCIIAITSCEMMSFIKNMNY